jgi:hypothetical protein
MLLLRPGDYRSRWERHATHADRGTIDLAAVARVAGVDEERARRALDGSAVDADLLATFVEAFELDGRDAARLGDLLRGTASVRAITGEAQALADVYARTGPPRHDTLALHELHVLGPDGSPAEHQTIQVIRAGADGLESYPYRFDTDELAVDVVRGGRVGDRIHRVDAGLWAVDIVLTRPLAPGETTLTHVRTAFFYQVPPPPEFRRGVLRRTDDVTIWVRFHRDRVPARVWLAWWDRLDHAKVVDREPAYLDDELSVHHRFGAIERAIVGFYWEWA